MAVESRQSIISNTKLPDSSSKLIFKDDILSSQFFRDYADMEILKKIRPEDIEDVSERYVPLYSSERESDTVKKVNISRYLASENSERQLNLPLYIISLIEHKTKVEYNVGMQILRYMIYIWEDYEKEMTKQHPGISRRKDFRYPPILPIVYYEGAESWTAPLDLAERILCGDLLGKYLPHFQYQLVKLHDYSNEDLLEKGDEISLAMMINKIQNLEDISSFANISGEQLSRILKDTPEYLLEIMAKLLRALLYKMNLPKDKTEDVVSKIKERKVAYLFENVNVDIQEEWRKLDAAKGELKEVQEKLQEGQEKLQEGQEKLQEGQEKLQEGQEKLQEEKGRLQEGQEKLRVEREELRKKLEELQRRAEELQRREKELQEKEELSAK